MRVWSALVIVAALSLLPLSAMAHGGSEIAVTGHTHPNGPIEIRGQAFNAGEIVALELRKQGEPALQLGSTPAGADGSFAVTLHVPETVRPALYQLVAVVGQETTSTEVTILRQPGQSANAPAAAANVSIINSRPGAETAGLAVVTALMAIAGGAVVLLERRRAAHLLAEN